MTTLINSTKVEDDYTISFAVNTKRKGFKAYDRYEVYSTATTIAEYYELAEKKFANADLRYDESKGLLSIFNEDGELMNPKEPKEELVGDED